MVDWMFRKRRAGDLTVAQLTNASLGVVLVATGLRWLVHPLAEF